MYWLPSRGEREFTSTRAAGRRGEEERGGEREGRETPRRCLLTRLCSFDPRTWNLEENLEASKEARSDSPLLHSRNPSLPPSLPPALPPSGTMCHRPVKGCQGGCVRGANHQPDADGATLFLFRACRLVGTRLRLHWPSSMKRAGSAWFSGLDQHCR